jgi:hypothetical protein
MPFLGYGGIGNGVYVEGKMLLENKAWSVLRNLKLKRPSKLRCPPPRCA